MKMSKLIAVSLVTSIIFLWGCAPSISVTPAGNEKQFEITVSSTDFVFDDTEELLNVWHKKARETCGGDNYRVITRNIIYREDSINEILVTGIIECQ